MAQEITPEYLTSIRERSFVMAAKAAGHSDEKIKAVVPVYRKQAAARQEKARAVYEAIVKTSGAEEPAAA